MIRSFLLVAVIGLFLGAGYFLPLPSDPELPTAVISEPPTATPPPAARPTRVRADTERTKRLQAEKMQEEEEERKRLIQLERGYAIIEDAEDRTTIIDAIVDLETPATVPALGRLFAIETNPELKEALIEAVGWGETTDAEKAAVYAGGLAAAQPASVRLVAIEGLADLEPAEALPLLRPLAEDPDAEVRAAALETIRSLETP